MEYNEDKPFLEDPDPTDAARKVLGDKIAKYKTKFREGHNFDDAHKE